MDKEKLITLGIGLSLGIIAAGIYLSATKALPSPFSLNLPSFLPKAKEEKPQALPQNNTVQTQNPSLTLTQPEDNFSTPDTTITITGLAPKESTLIVLGNSDEKIASTSATGNFSVQIKLEEGENEVSVTAVTKSSQTPTIKRNITREIVQ